MKTLIHALLRTSLTCLLLVAFVTVNAQQIVKDDSYNDPTFVAFKTKLLGAVLYKDTTALFTLADDGVKTADEICDGVPITCFKDIFREVPAQVNPAWNELYRAISYGFNETTVKRTIPGYARKGEVIFQAPSYQEYLPERDDQLLVLGEMVNVRYAPSPTSTIITRVTNKRLLFNDPYNSPSLTAFNLVDGKLWYEVILSDGQRGYIHEDYVSASLTRELSVKKVEGEWKIISFYKKPTPGC